MAIFFWLWPLALAVGVGFGAPEPITVNRETARECLSTGCSRLSNDQRPTTNDKESYSWNLGRKHGINGVGEGENPVFSPTKCIFSFSLPRFGSLI